MAGVLLTQGHRHQIPQPMIHGAVGMKTQMVTTGNPPPVPATNLVRETGSAIRATGLSSARGVLIVIRQIPRAVAFVDLDTVHIQETGNVLYATKEFLHQGLRASAVEH